MKCVPHEFVNNQYINSYALLILESQPIVVTANTRAIQGLQMSANNRFLVSFIDNSVNIWDIRMFEKAVSQFNMQKIISHISWCPTRNNVLTTLHRESYLMNLIDIHWSGIESDMDPHFIKRVISPFEVIDKKNKYNFMTKNVSLDYLSWHPQQAERLLIISNTNILLDFKVSDRVCVTWDNYNKLWSNCGGGIKPVDIGSPSSSPTDSLTSWDLTVNQLREYEGTDIADLMRKRVQDNYGQFTSLDQNAKHSYVPALYCVWKVLGEMQKSECLYGIKSILGVAGQDNEPLTETVCESKTWSDFPTSGSIKVYRSGPRETAQIVCGWPFARGGDPAFKGHIQKLCERKEYTRAAMMACFALKVRYAIEILGRGADDVDDKRNELRMSAIALSGFNLDKSGIWRAQSASAYKQIIDPHLRAIFSFLASESENFENVLNECGVSLGDRIAFACSFLSDQKLNDFVKKTIQICIDDGDLNGLLLTGNNVEGVTLLQSYVDKTDDVQTAALIGCRILPPELINDKRMQCWITNYRDLMDLWGLYDWRAKFDMMNGSIRSPPKSPKSVFLLCSFCGKSVSAALQEEARHRNQVAQPNKLSSCPNCRKPLPRCALCLLHMGTPMNTLDNNNTMKSKPFSKWFSWCQTCRHGGHTEHLSEWFASHTECPVTSCTCKCFAMDLPVPKFTGDFSF